MTSSDLLRVTPRDLQDADPEAALDRLGGPAHLRPRRPPRRVQVRHRRHRRRQRHRPRRHLEHAAATQHKGITRIIIVWKLF